MSMKSPAFVVLRHVWQAVRGLDRKRLKDLHRRLLLGNAEDLVSLKAQSPARMLEAIPHSEFRIAYALRAIHGLEKEVIERQLFEQLGFCALLRKDQLQFIPVSKHEFASSLRADADPVDPLRSRMSAVRLNGHFDPKIVKCLDERL